MITEAKSLKVTDRALHDAEHPHYFLIAGDELLLQRETLTGLSSALGKKPYQVTEQVLFTNDYDLEELLGFVNNTGWSGDVRFYKIYIEDVKKQADLAQVIRENDQVHCYAFIFNKWDKAAKDSAIVKELEKVNSLFYNCSSVVGEQYKRWLRQRLQDLKFTFAGDVVDYLYDNYENNMTEVAQLLDQLATREVKTLTIDMLAEVVSQVSEYSVFDLTLALFQGNIVRAFKVYDYLKQHTKTEDIAIIALLRRDLFNIWKSRNLYRQPQPETIADLMQWPLADAYSLNSNSHFNAVFKYYKRTAAINLIPTFSYEKIYKLFNQLADLEIALRTGLIPAVDIERKLKDFMLKFLPLSVKLPGQSYCLLDDAGNIR